MFCHNCGHKNPEGVNFCSSCGNPLLTEGDDGDQTRRHVEQERAEVADERDGDKGVGQPSVSVRRENAEFVPKIVLVQGRRVRGCGAQIDHGREDAEDDRDKHQEPDCAMRGERLAVQQAELSGDFLVAAHGISHARAGVHAGEGGANQGEKDRASLYQHEGLAGRITAKQRSADQKHHVAERRAGSAGIGHGVTTIQEIVGCEILEKVTNRALNRQGQQDNYSVPR